MTFIWQWGWTHSIKSGFLFLLMLTMSIPPQAYSSPYFLASVPDLPTVAGLYPKLCLGALQSLIMDLWCWWWIPLVLKALAEGQVELCLPYPKILHLFPHKSFSFQCISVWNLHSTNWPINVFIYMGIYSLVLGPGSVRSGGGQASIGKGSVSPKVYNSAT